MRSVLCVRSLQCVASAMWTPIGRATSTRLIPVFSSRFTRPAPDGFHHQARLHGFASTSLICSYGFHPKLLSQQSKEHLYYYRDWLIAGIIELHLLLGRGVIRLVSKWQVLACATTIIRRRLAMIRLIESPSSGCPCRRQPRDTEDLAALFTLATVFGMLVRVVAWAF